MGWAGGGFTLSLDGSAYIALTLVESTDSSSWEKQFTTHSEIAALDLAIFYLTPKQVKKW